MATPDLVTHTRGELLADAAALLPIVVKMGDATFVRAMDEEVTRVCTWWR